MSKTHGNLRTGLYCLDIRQFNSDVAHLYEHLLIRSFGYSLKNSGYLQSLYGWVGGETFRDLMFIDYGFYNPKVEQLFNDFIRQKSKLNIDLLDLELSRIESELLTNVVVGNREILINHLQEINSHAWINLSAPSAATPVHHFKQPAKQIKPRLLVEKESKKSFKNITVIFALPNATKSEKITFLGLTPIVSDAINYALFDLGLYQNENSWPVYNQPHDTMLGHSIFTLKRSSHSNKSLEIAAKQAITTLNLDNHQDELDCYISGFLQTPNWHTFPIDYFRYSGILASKDAIAKGLTAASISKILNRLELKVVNTTKDHWRSIRQ